MNEYLDKLRAELRDVPARRRRRIVDEAEDHLRSAVEGGASEADAVAAFGAPSLIARRWLDLLAVVAARRAVWIAAAPVAAWGLLFLLAGQPGVVGLFAVQIAAVCGFVAGVRLLRHLDATALPAGTLRYLNRTTASALVASLVGAASVVPELPLAGGVVAAACALALVVTGGAFRRLGALADEPAPDDALDDIRVLVGRLPELGFDLRRHRWRFASVVALVAGVVAAAGHALTDDGGSMMIGPRALAAGALILAIEGAAVLACFALLGRFLGLVHYSGSPSPNASRVP